MRKANPQTKMIGLRVAEDLYSLIEKGAEREGVSATGYTRLILARDLNYCEAVPETRVRRRKRRKPVNENVKAAVKFLGLLIDVKMKLTFVSRSLSKQAAFESINSDKLLEQQKLIERATAYLEDIRRHLLGDRV